MDRVEFVKSMNDSNISSDDIVRFFDHTMALYNLVGTSEIIEITRDIELPNSISAISFYIKFSNNDQAITMRDTIHNTYNSSVAIYGRNFQITDVLMDNVLRLQLY